MKTATGLFQEFILDNLNLCICVSSAADFTLVNNPRLQVTGGNLSAPSRDSELPVSSRTNVTVEAGRDLGGEPRWHLGVAFVLQNIGVARSNTAEATIVLMKDMWICSPLRNTNMPAVCVSVIPGKCALY